jgi:hypothetical protein
MVCVSQACLPPPFFSFAAVNLPFFAGSSFTLPVLVALAAPLPLALLSESDAGEDIDDRGEGEAAGDPRGESLLSTFFVAVGTPFLAPVIDITGFDLAAGDDGGEGEGLASRDRLSDTDVRVLLALLPALFFNGPAPAPAAGFAGTLATALEDPFGALAMASRSVFITCGA